MQHSDPDDLVLIALGDAPPSVGSEHLNECSRCAQDLADLARVVDAGRAPNSRSWWSRHRTSGPVYAPS